MKKNNVRVAAISAVLSVMAVTGSANAQPVPQPGASELATLAAQYRVDQLRGWASMPTCDQWSRVAEAATNAAVANTASCTADATNAATALNGTRRECNAERADLRSRLAAAEARCPAPPAAPSDGERPLVRAAICRADLGGATPVCRIRGRREDTRGQECLDHARELVMSRCECGAGGVVTRVARTPRTFYCGTPFGNRIIPPTNLTPAVAQEAVSFEARLRAVETGMGALCTASWSANPFVQRQLVANADPPTTEGGEATPRPLTGEQFAALPMAERCTFVVQALHAALQQLAAGNTTGANASLGDAETRFRALENRVTAVEANVSRRPIFRLSAEAFFLFRADGVPASGGSGVFSAEFPLGQKFSLYAQVGVGGGYYGYAANATDSAARFMWGAGFGARVHISDRVAFQALGVMRNFVDSGLQSEANTSHGDYLGWFFGARLGVDLVFDIHVLTLAADVGATQDARDMATRRPDGTVARWTENVTQFAGGGLVQYGLRF